MNSSPGDQTTPATSHPSITKTRSIKAVGSGGFEPPSDGHLAPLGAATDEARRSLSAPRFAARLTAGLYLNEV